MSLARDIQLQGWAAQAQVSGDTFIVLSSAFAKFNGIIDPAPGIDPRMDLGSDIRELATIQVLSDELPDLVVSQVQIKQISVPDTPIWRVIRREANPSDITTKLWVCKVVQGLDQ